VLLTSAQAGSTISQATVEVSPAAPLTLKDVPGVRAET
jgi:hypothetical protein